MDHSLGHTYMQGQFDRGYICEKCQAWSIAIIAWYCLPLNKQFIRKFGWKLSVCEISVFYGNYKVFSKIFYFIAEGLHVN